MRNKSLQRATPVLIGGLITLIAAWPLAGMFGLTATIDAIAAQSAMARVIVLGLLYGGVFTLLAIILRGSALLLRLRFMAGNVLRS